MSEKETVEVTLKIPKKLLNVLENEKYFGWSKQDFFIAAVIRSISCEVEDISFEESDRLKKKYGFEPSLLQFDEKKVLIYS